MSKRYFTSDLHFNSTLINKYAKRPYRDALKAGEFLVDNANDLLTKEDLLIHVGDFCLTSVDRHGKEEDIPLSFSPDYWKTRIKARLVLLAGNHDDGHSFEADCKSMVLDLNQNWRNVYVNHFPSDHKDYHGPHASRRNDRIFINLCGHVHDKWKYYYDNKNYVLNYNVGVDCHNYRPVKDSDITEDLDFIFTHHDFNNSWKMTCEDEVKWKAEIKLNLNIARTKRKHDRYLKKGLTEAECLRRKEEALRKKGLLKSK